MMTGSKQWREEEEEEEEEEEAFILCKINKAEWMTKYNSYSAKGYR